MSPGLGQLSDLSFNPFPIQGIRNFRRQTTKEDRFKPIVDEEFNDADEVEDLDKLRDDLESTKQLLELEVRSKALLEKDNKRMQSELERMRNELMKMQAVATGELFFWLPALF